MSQARTVNRLLLCGLQGLAAREGGGEEIYPPIVGRRGSNKRSRALALCARAQLRELDGVPHRFGGVRGETPLAANSRALAPGVG